MFERWGLWIYRGTFGKGSFSFFRGAWRATFISGPNEESFSFFRGAWRATFISGPNEESFSLFRGA